jgi:predicted nucleic acid-binding protein
VILVDTDVLLDVALDRAPHVDSSAALLHYLERDPRQGFVAWHSLSNLYYLIRPGRGSGSARAFLQELVEFVTVAPTDTEAMRFAASLPLSDIEDAMEVAAARSCGALYIATRNVEDFERSPIPARTPTQLLEEFG